MLQHLEFIAYWKDDPYLTLQNATPKWCLALLAWFVSTTNHIEVKILLNGYANGNISFIKESHFCTFSRLSL